MTRRKFIQKLTGMSSAIIVGVWWLAKKAAPRKFVQAVRFHSYPGSVKTLPRLYKQGKWSG